MRRPPCRYGDQRSRRHRRGTRDVFRHYRAQAGGGRTRPAGWRQRCPHRRAPARARRTRGAAGGDVARAAHAARSHQGLHQQPAPARCRVGRGDPPGLPGGDRARGRPLERADRRFAEHVSSRKRRGAAAPADGDGAGRARFGRIGPRARSAGRRATPRGRATQTAACPGRCRSARAGGSQSGRERRQVRTIERRDRCHSRPDRQRAGAGGRRRRSRHPR